MEENTYHMENLVYSHQGESKLFNTESIMYFLKKRPESTLDLESRKHPINIGEWTPVWAAHQEAEFLWTHTPYLKF